MPALCCTQQETSKRGVSRAHCRPGPEPGRFVEPAVRSPAISERRSGGLGRLWCGLLSLARSRLSGVAYSGATAWQSSKAAQLLAGDFFFFPRGEAVGLERHFKGSSILI